MFILRKSSLGFTLLEILIALFIFSIVSMIMVSALHTIMLNQNSLEKNTSRFDDLQLAITLMSRDFEQIIDRPITNANNTEDDSFIGDDNSVTFTSTGNTNPLNQLQRSTLQRIEYSLKNGNIIRKTWGALDQTRHTSSSERKILSSITALHFEYLDQQSHFQHRWPLVDKTDSETLPQAIRISITLNDLGKISQLYIIPGQQIDKNSTKTK